MGVFQNSLMGAAAAAASGGGGTTIYDYQIPKSVRMNKVSDSDGANFSKTFSGAPTSTKKGTFSTWLKRASVPSNETHNILGTGAGGGSSEQDIKFLNNTLTLTGYSPAMNLISTQLFRDTSGWYHIVVAWDTTQGTDTNRIKAYVNGEQITSFSTSTYPSQNDTIEWFSNTENRIGLQSWNDNNVYNGYMAETIGIDGTTYAASDFGETVNGVWVPKDASGLTFGNNGFYLNYASSGDLGNDVSGNNNDWTANNLAAHDQMLDSPTFNSDSNGGNFATIGPLWKTSDMTFSEGNLKWTCSTNERGLMSNWAVPIGTKAYWEYIPVSWGGNTSNGDEMWIGINQGIAALVGGDRGGKTTAYGYGTSNGYKTILASTSSYGATIRANDVVGVAVDRVNHTINFSKNGSWQGTFAISSTMDLFPFIGSGGGSSSATGTFNFGQDGTFAGTVTAQGNSDDTGYGNFFYAPPTGFLAMCAGNLPVADAIDPAQTDDNYPQKLFSPLIWTGNDATSRAITGLGFQPDLLWFKNRSSAFSHRLYDTTRGIASNGGKRLFINTSGAEVDQTSGQDISAIGTDGFTMGASSGLYNNDTNSGGLQSGFFWRLNGGTEVSNGNGGIASTVQVDPSGGFSLVKYSGTGSASTVGHGLSSAPTWIFAKRYNATNSWIIYTTAMTGSYYMTIDAGGMGADSTMWNNTNSTSSVFSVGTAAATNGGSQLAYCWADVDGYIKSGSYEGNGNVDGSFVYCGFRPAFIICKSIDSGTSWQMFDDKRAGYNVDNNSFLVDLANAEATTDMIDILSNGFKLKIATDPNIAETYIYLAIAENPFKYATAR